MTHLRQAMLEELQRRNYAKTTVYYYLKAVERFAKYFHTSPDQLNQSHLRPYQAYLLRERKLGPRTVKLHVSALRFFFVKTLKRPYLLEDIPFPKVPRRLPVILTTEEVARLIDGAKNLTDRTMLMVPRTSSKRGPTCGPCSSCSGTSNSSTPSSICTYRSGICKRSPIRLMRCRSPRPTPCAARAGCTSGDAATLRGGRHRAPTWRSRPGDAPRLGQRAASTRLPGDRAVPHRGARRAPRSL